MTATLKISNNLVKNMSTHTYDNRGLVKTLVTSWSLKVFFISSLLFLFTSFDDIN